MAGPREPAGTVPAVLEPAPGGDGTARDRTAADLEARVAALLGAMTLEEKIAQLGGVWAFSLMRAGVLDRDGLTAHLASGIGEITRLAGSTNLRPAEVAAAANVLQRFLVEETRLGIPAIIHEETLHGLLAWAAPCFQQSIGVAATFDPDLAGRAAATLRRRMLATGARHALAPVIDLGTDPRWGRIEETYGEDPYLASAMGVAYIRGLQGDSLAEGVVATAKHLVAHGMSEGGLNQAPAHLGWRQLRDEQLVPFETAVREAGIGSIMPTYCEVDGVPCHASRELIEGVVRGEWGFDGVIASDYIGIEQLALHHHLTDEMEEAAALALEAGVDLELPRPRAYAEPLAAAVRSGRVPAATLDASVGRVLRLKLRLGLFEDPYVAIPDDARLAELATEEAAVARLLAVRSIVLLENDGVLPLAEGRRVAVVGPIADSARDLLGDYSHLVHIETLLEMRAAENPLGFIVSDEVSVADELEGRRTVLDALRERLGDGAVTFARGAGLIDGTDDELAEAVAVARAADVAVLVLGERSGLTADATTGESRDRRDLGLLGRQQELLEAVVATGTPVVLVVVSGRPLALEWAARHCAAVLLAWVPGDAGPDAIADVLTGAENASGKLPVSMPRHVGQVPLTYRHHPSGGRSNWKVDHVDGVAGPLWAFGFGRSFTTFAVSDLVLGADELATDGGRLTACVTVANTGTRAGDEVVQLYARDEQAQVARPILELCAFRRVHLEPGERRRVTFDLSAEQFAYTGAAYRRIIEPGEVTLRAGMSSADLPLAATVRLVGPVVELPVRDHYLAGVRVD